MKPPDTQDINKRTCNPHSPPTSVMVVRHRNPTARPGPRRESSRCHLHVVRRPSLLSRATQLTSDIYITHLKSTKNCHCGPSYRRAQCQPPCDNGRATGNRCGALIRSGTAVRPSQRRDTRVESRSRKREGTSERTTS